jgi:hypothetical protein
MQGLNRNFDDEFRTARLSVGRRHTAAVSLHEAIDDR